MKERLLGMKRFARLTPWLYGFLAATLVLFFLNQTTYFRYENSDDILMVKAYMGFEGGSPAPFQLSQHALLSRLMGLLFSIDSSLAWFSLLQVGCLWLSLAVICACNFLCVKKALPFMMGIFASFIFIVVFAAFALARINFTTTAAMLGAAAVALLVNAACSAAPSAFSVVLSILFLLGSYMLRAQSCLAVFPFWMLAAAYLLILHRRSAKKLLLLFAAGLILFAGLYVIQTIETSDPEIQELIHFQDANAGPMDYAEDRLMSVSDDVLAEIGWTRSELALVQQWYFMDENITPEAFEVLDAALSSDTTLASRLAQTLDTLFSFFSSQPRYVLCCAILLLLALLSFISDSVLTRLAALGSIALAAAMLCYLAFQGRFLSRAADCALFPAAVLLCVLAARAAGSPASAKKKALAVCIAVICCACTLLHAGMTSDLLSDRPDFVSASREATLEEYALAHPHKLLLRTPNLLRDTRLFPDVSSGTPTNIMIWGDWNCRTPSWYDQLEKLGFDGRHFTAADFLNENLLFVTEQSAPPAELLAYIHEFTGLDVTYELTDTSGDLHFFRFVS